MQRFEGITALTSTQNAKQYVLQAIFAFQDLDQPSRALVAPTVIRLVDMTHPAARRAMLDGTALMGPRSHYRVRRVLNAVPAQHSQNCAKEVFIVQATQRLVPRVPQGRGVLVAADSLPRARQALGHLIDRLCQSFAQSACMHTRT